MLLLASGLYKRDTWFIRSARLIVVRLKLLIQKNRRRRKSRRKPFPRSRVSNITVYYVSCRNNVWNNYFNFYAFDESVLIYIVYVQLFRVFDSGYLRIRLQPTTK